MKGRQIANPAARCLGMLPRGLSGGRWLYAIGIPGGLTKIGVTGKPRERALHHWKSHGGLEWFHLSAQINRRQAVVAEKQACRLAESHGMRLGDTEQFIGLAKSAALDCIRTAVRMTAAPTAEQPA